MKSPVKHTLKGLHGHCYRYDTVTKTGKTVCLDRSVSAQADFDYGEYDLREKISKKWKVCLDCWASNPGDKYYGRNSKGKKFLVAYSCGFGKCKAWGKPIKVYPKRNKDDVKLSLFAKRVRNK